MIGGVDPFSSPQEHLQFHELFVSRKRRREGKEIKLCRFYTETTERDSGAPVTSEEYL